MGLCRACRREETVDSASGPRTRPHAARSTGYVGMPLFAQSSQPQVFRQQASGVEPDQSDTTVVPTQGGTDRKKLFCHKCASSATLKVGVYSQSSSDFINSNITFAKIFMLNHNVTLDIDSAGVIPTQYNEEQKKFVKVETVADLCDILKDLKARGVFPPSAGTLPALFIPFGSQLRGSSAETVGWHIPNINNLCEAHVGKLDTSRVVLIDSSDDVKSCSKVLLHEIGHAVGCPDVPDSPMIMGPCDSSSTQKAPMTCDGDRTQHRMVAKDVKKFCTGSFS